MHLVLEWSRRWVVQNGADSSRRTSSTYKFWVQRRPMYSICGRFPWRNWNAQGYSWKEPRRHWRSSCRGHCRQASFMVVLIWCSASVCCWLLLSPLDMPFPELHYLICSCWLRCTVLPSFCANTSKLLRDFVKKLKSPIELHYYCCFCQEYFGPEKPQHVQIQLVWWTLSRRNHSCTILLLYPLYTNFNQ